MEHKQADNSTPDLPPRLLIKVLQLVPVGQRLKACALTSHQLCSAAGAATTTIDLPYCREPRYSSLAAWMRRHGQHVAALSLRGCHCISLAGHAATSSSGDNASSMAIQPGLLDGATSLTKLCLDNCCLVDTAPAAAAAAAIRPLTGLQHLELTGSGTVPAEAWSGLGRLTRLRLSDSGPEATLQRVNAAGLTALRDLKIAVDPDTPGSTGAALSGLQHLQQLTRLDLTLGLQLQLGAGSNGAWLAGLPALQELCIRSHQETYYASREREVACSIEPGLISGLTQLQHLELDCRYQPEGPPGAAALLAALAPLRQLTHLHLGAPENLPLCPPSPAAYSALTASSRLRCLSLSHCQLLAPGLWQHVFPAGRVLRDLRNLDLLLLCDAGGADLVTSTADLPALVNCCPGLQELDMREGALGMANLWQPGVLAPLTRLTGLTQLIAWGVSLRNLADVARLTGLQYLEMTLAATPSASDLLPLASLRALTGLQLAEGMQGEWADVYIFSLRNEACQGSPSNLWRQVLRGCLEWHNAMPVAASNRRAHAQQGAALRARIRQLLQEASGL